MSREPCGCVRKSEQGSHRGAQVVKRVILSAEDRLRLIVVNLILGTTCPPVTATSDGLVTVFCICVTCAMEMNTTINTMFIMCCDQKEVTMLLVSWLFEVHSCDWP